MSKEKPLRFAILCRVSTEKQAHDRKVSLGIQEKQIRAAVEALGGTIAREYKGNEHATPGFEHAMVEKMLAEAQRKNKPFDAVMVAEPSRWSRDNVASASGLDIFKASGVRFFCGTTEYDLFDPVAAFVLAQFVNMNQFFAATQNKKSVQAKITYAKQGRPGSGNLPFGRTWDLVNGWGIDPVKKSLIEDVAKRYLAGESLVTLAAEYGVSRRNLHEVLRNRCGTTFIQRFDVPSLNIKETVESKIPALLPAHTIKAIQKLMEKRHAGGGTGNGAHAYLLGGYVRCGECGACLSPQANGGTRYYRHAATCTHIDGLVRADDLERVVSAQLVGLMGNPAAVAKAAEAYQVALGNVKEQQAKAAHVDTELDKITKAQKRYVDLLAQDAVDESMVYAKLEELRTRQHKLEEERDQLAVQLAAVPTQEAIEQAAKRAKARLRNLKLNNVLLKSADVPRADLEALIKEAFDNTTHPNGKWPGGVYITDIPGAKRKRPRRWGYEIHGNLPDKGMGEGVNYGRTDLPPEAYENSGDEGEEDCVNDCAAPALPALHVAFAGERWQGKLIDTKFASRVTIPSTDISGSLHHAYRDITWTVHCSYPGHRFFDRPSPGPPRRSAHPADHRAGRPRDLAAL